MLNQIRNTTLVRIFAPMGKRIWAYSFALFIYSVTIAICLNIIVAFVTRDVLNAAITGQSVLLGRAITLGVSAYLIGAVVLCISYYICWWCIRKTVAAFRIQVFSHVVDLPMGHFEREHSGDLISRCTNDIGIIGGVYWYQLEPLLAGIFIGIIALISMFWLEWRLGLLALAAGFLTVGSNAALAGPLRHRSDLLQQRLGKLTERLTDLLQSVPVTKMFHLEALVHRLYTHENDLVTSATLSHARLDAFTHAIGFFTQFFGIVGLFGVGSLMVIEGRLDMGTAMAIVLLQGQANYLYGNIGGFITGIQSSLAGAQRVFELLDAATEPKDYPLQLPEGRHPTKSEAAIEIQKLSFHYKNGGNGREGYIEGEALYDINLAVARGQVAALVGPSGGGKSTLVKLLLGFYPLQEGSLAINGQPSGAYSKAHLRQYMAYVPQDAFLFDGSIEENIRYGRPDASPDEVVAAAQAANAHGFILEQSNGYATVVGERGAKLSGGQRQRIAIARALLKDAPILLLDEATSALDSESEQLVQQALEVLMQGRTTLVVAHRLSTIERADIIYVLADGRIVEQGRHADLIAQRGLYSTLYGLQYKR